MGISRKRVKKWLDRYAAEGEAGLRDRPSRPHSCPRRTSTQVEQQILKLRHDERRGPDWIGAELGVPARTVSRVLARHRVPHLCTLDPMTGEVIRASKAAAIRYERDRPGELAHMDVKKLGKIHEHGGWRAHGGAATSVQRHKRDKIGFDYAHSWSMTTPGWPTPRSSPTRKAQPALRSSSARSPTSRPTASPASSGS